MWRKRNTPPLLVGLQNGTTTLEISLLFSSVPHLLMRLFDFLESTFLSSLYILEISPLSDLGLVKILSQSVGGLFVLLTVSLQICNFMRSHLSILNFTVQAIGVRFRNFFPYAHILAACPHFLLYNFQCLWFYVEFLGNGNPGPGESGYERPQILPDGKSVLFSVYLPPNDYRTEVLSLDTREQKTVLESGKDVTYVETGHLVYEQPGTGNLMAVVFDLEGLAVTGDPVPVLQRVRGNLPGATDYAVSENGTLVYVPGGGQQLHEHTLVWVNRDGQETVVTEEKRAFAAPRISPDGKRVALSVGDQTGRYLAMYDFEADSFNRLTFEDERSGSQVWSPDGKWLIFQAGQVGGESGIVRQPFDGSRPQERLTSTTQRQMPHSWSPDGQYVAFTESGRPGGFDIAILPTEGEPTPQFIISSEAAECCPQFSPDGKWLAYVSNELGRNNVYVSPFPEPDVKRLVSVEVEGGEQPVWSPDGKEIFYRSGNRMMVASVQAGDQAFNVGRPEVLFQGSYVSTHSAPQGYQYYSISPDGRRFLMMKEETAQQGGQINVVLNWFEELKRLVPTN